MPGKIRKLKSGKFRVTWGKEITAKGTTKKKAISQLRLLYGIEGGMKVRRKRNVRK